MTTAANVMQSENGNGSSYYDPAKDFSGKIPEGLFPAHIVNLEIDKDRPVRGIHLADIYNTTYRIAPEASGLTFTYIDKTVGEDGETVEAEKEISGAPFAGREIRGTGVFRFKNPQGSRFRSLQDNRGGNIRYKEFLEFIGILPDIIEVDGKTLYKLTSLTEEMIFGLPLLIRVYHSSFESRRPENKGQIIETVKAIHAGPWKEGERLSFDDGSVPF